MTQQALTSSHVQPDRRARRRQETIDEILRIAVDVMSQDGVNALSMAEIARRLGVQPPSIYKYFDSLLAIYDELFRRGQAEHLQVMRAAMANADPGLPALTAGLEASGRWCLTHRAVAQLLFWRPVPTFEPSPEAFGPSVEMVNLQRSAITDAIASGQLGPADPDEAIDLISTFIVGLLSQAMANEPDVEWGHGRFTPLFPRLITLIPALYPPTTQPRGARQTGRHSTPGHGDPEHDPPKQAPDSRSRRPPPRSTVPVAAVVQTSTTGDFKRQD